MTFFLYQNGLVAPLQQMSHRAVAPIVELGVDPVELTHAAGEVGFWRFNLPLR